MKIGFGYFLIIGIIGLIIEVAALIILVKTIGGIGFIAWVALLCFSAAAFCLVFHEVYLADQKRKKK